MSEQAISIFIKLAKSGALEQFLLSSGSRAMPNIPFPTMGGALFWDNLASCNGWRLQRNTILGNCRILDSNDIRRAWGTMSAMEELFSKFEK
ncbi:MAG: hypothetical protein ACRDAQ_03955 [Cetobacterium sp.]